MEKTKTYSECEEVREPLSDVQFLYGKVEQLVKENADLKETIRVKDEVLNGRAEELVKTNERCDYAYAFCYELQHTITGIKDMLEHSTKKNTMGNINMYEKDWAYLTDKYDDEFTKPYNLRKREILL